MDILSTARKALAVASTLLYRRTITHSSAQGAQLWYMDAQHRGLPLTARDDDPDKVHEEIVDPEIIGFGPAVGNALMVVIEHASRVI